VQVVHNIFPAGAGTGRVCRGLKHNGGIIARCPLDEGALSGKITPDSKFAEGSFLEGYFKEAASRSYMIKSRR
jgi:hypothetical protein